MTHRDDCGRCEAVLRAIDEWSELNGYPPSIRELMQATGIPSESMVVYHVDDLVERGHVRKAPGIARGTSITPAGREAVRARSAG